MIVCLSFDDGRSDAFYSAFPIMLSTNIVGTFHITTGFIDGTFRTNAFGRDRKPLRIESLQEMKNNKMEISSHGDKHIMETRDFLISISKIREWELGLQKIGFSVPNSKYDDKSLSEFIKKNREHLSYVRVGRHPKCYSLNSKIHYFVYHYLVRNYKSFLAFNKFNINKMISSCFYSIVVKRDIKPKHICNFIKDNMSENGIIVLMFHSIMDFPSNDWEYGADNFKYICSFIQKMQNDGKITNMTLQEIIDKNGIR